MYTTISDKLRHTCGGGRALSTAQQVESIEPSGNICPKVRDFGRILGKVRVRMYTTISDKLRHTCGCGRALSTAQQVESIEPSANIRPKVGDFGRI
jgi:hypothetical protein